MQRLAGFRQYAWRCESRSLPNASPQRHNTHTHAIFLFTDTGTHCLLLLPANPQQQQQHNLLWVVLQPFQTGHSFACLSSYMLLPAVFDFCFSRKDTDQHCSKILYDESRSFDQKKREKDDVGASSHASAKPFILKPMRMGQTVSALWFSNHLRRFSHG